MAYTPVLLCFAVAFAGHRFFGLGSSMANVTHTVSRLVLLSTGAALLLVVAKAALFSLYFYGIMHLFSLVSLEALLGPLNTALCVGIGPLVDVLMIGGTIGLFVEFSDRKRCGESVLEAWIIGATIRAVIGYVAITFVAFIAFAGDRAGHLNSSSKYWMLLISVLGNLGWSLVYGAAAAALSAFVALSLCNHKSNGWIMGVGGAYGALVLPFHFSLITETVYCLVVPTALSKTTHGLSVIDLFELLSTGVFFGSSFAPLSVLGSWLDMVLAVLGDGISMTIALCLTGVVCYFVHKKCQHAPEHVDEEFGGAELSDVAAEYLVEDDL